MLEELRELFFTLCRKKNNLSEEQLLELKQAFEFETHTIEKILSLAARNDLLHLIERFVEKGGDLHFVIDECGEKLNLLNIAAEEGSLNIIKYLLDNNIFNVDQRAFEDSKTPFHSTVEYNNIESAKLLLKRGADIQAKFKHGIVKTAVHEVFGSMCDANGVQHNYLEMAKFLVKHGVDIPDHMDLLCRDWFIQQYPAKGSIKNFLLSIKNLENLQITNQKSNFIKAYEVLDSETQEVWNIRKSREDLKKIANFIEEKFSKETVIKYEEYQYLRKYNSLPKHKKDALEIFLTNEKFTFHELITKVDNFINNHFLEIAAIAKNLENNNFEILGETIMPHITQYLKFEDIKIAGANLDDDIN